MAALVELANRHVALVPPWGARLTERALSLALTQSGRLWRHHDREEPSAATYQALVALCDGEPTGAIVAGRRRNDEHGDIPLLIADPRRPDAADRLLDAAAASLRAQGCTSMQVADRCPLGLGWFGVPMTWAHVVAALERAGFIPVDYWIIMAGDASITDVEPATAPSPPDWNVFVIVHDDHREWRLELYHRDELAGECEAWGIPPHLDDCPGFGDWITIEWLGIEEPYRRRGLGRWLMVRQLHYQLGAGRTKAMLWTGPANVPARELYHRLGFTDGPETRIFRRAL